MLHLVARPDTESSEPTATKPTRRRKRRRGSSKHPHVTLIKPDVARGIGWRARWRDPDTLKEKKVSLPSELTEEGQRTAWAVAKEGELKTRTVQLETGAVRRNGFGLADTLERYFHAHPHLGEKTLRGYRDAANKLLRYAASNGINTADEMDRAKLIGFREHVIGEKKAAPAKSGKRGQFKRVDRRRSPVTINRELRSVGTVLAYLIDLDLFSRLHFDDLRRALKKLPIVRERIEFLRQLEIRALLVACDKHDAERFEATREEHAGRGKPGSTPRHTQIANFARFVLLTGMRLSEACSLTWHQVDLDAQEIHLLGRLVKTKQARTVDLSVSPALVAMLTAMKKKNGKGSVFGLTADEAKSAMKRLCGKPYNAPAGFSWQALRRTCGTFLTNAPGIFGAASAYRSAKQLGHSVVIAEKHYVGLVKIPKEATTLEAAMGL